MGTDGHDVLAIDLDPQRGSLTHYMGHAEKTHGDDDVATPTIMDVMFEDVPAEDIIVETPNFDIMPGHEELSNFTSRLDSTSRRGANRFYVVRDMIDEVKDQYDVIVVDCKASLDDLVDNAIVGTEGVFVPLEMTSKGKASQEALEATIGEMQDGFADFGVDVRITGCVPSRVGQAKIFESYREHHEEDDVPVSPFVIPEHSLLKYTWHHKMDIFAFIESDETRKLREYERHVPLAFKVIGRWMSGEFSYSDAVDVWDRVKDDEMGDATPEALADDNWAREEEVNA